MDWFARLKDAGALLGSISETVLYKRVHDNNLSGDLDGNHRELLRIMRTTVQRQKHVQEV